MSRRMKCVLWFLAMQATGLCTLAFENAVWIAPVYFIAFFLMMFNLFMGIGPPDAEKLPEARPTFKKG